MTTWRIEIDKQPAGSKVWPARVSIPVPHGEDIAAGFTATTPTGEKHAVQHRALTSYPDGSPRWAQLDFLTTEKGEHVISVGSCDDRPEAPTSLQTIEGGYRITAGRFACDLLPDGDGLCNLSWDGNLIAAGQAMQFEVTMQNGEELTVSGARDVKVEADGAHRVQLSWTASQIDGEGKEILEVRFRAEALAGLEGVSLSYQFFHKLPKAEALFIKSMRAKFALDTVDGRRTAVMQRGYHDAGLPRFPRLDHAYEFTLDRTEFYPYVQSADVLDDDYDYPPHLDGIQLAVQPTVAFEDESKTVLFAQRDFIYQRPKKMRGNTQSAEIDIWPESAEPMRLPQGRSSRQVFDIRVVAVEADRVDQLLALGGQQITPVQGWLHKDDSHHAGGAWEQRKLLSKSDPGAKMFSYLLGQACTRFWTVPEMFHYGDTPDDGYNTTYAAIGRIPEYVQPQTELPLADTPITHKAFITPDHLPKVWSNNEYDAIYCLALEAMRTHDATAFRRMAAAARHQIEVDFLHYGDHWQRHRGTPAHSYDHTAGTGIIPSHQWTQGLYYYYILTGDDDVIEAIRGICDKNIELITREDIQFMYRFNRELGWPLVAMVFGYEATGDETYIKFAKDIIRRLEKEAGPPPEEAIPNPNLSGFSAKLLGTNFNFNTILLGLSYYHEVTGEADAFDRFKQWMAVGFPNFNNRSTSVKLAEIFTEPMVYACQTTEDDTMLRESAWQLRGWLRGFNSMSWLEDSTCPLSTKRLSRVYRGLSCFLPALAKIGVLAEIEREVFGAEGDSNA